MTTHPHLEGLIRKWRAGADRRRQIAKDAAAIEATDDEAWNNGLAEAADECADELEAALAALPGGGVDDSPLMPALAVLKETNPVVRACFDMYRHAQSRGYPFSLHSMLALLIAEMDRRHDRIEKLALDTLNMRPGPFFIPTPNPHEADQ